MVASSSHCTKFTQTTLMNCRQLKHTTTLWENVLRRHGKLKFVNNGDLNDKSRTRKNRLRVELKVGLWNCQQMKAYNDALEHKETYGIANNVDPIFVFIGMECDEISFDLNEGVTGQSMLTCTYTNVPKGYVLNGRLRYSGGPTQPVKFLRYKDEEMAKKVFSQNTSAVETDAHHNIYETSPCIFAPPAIYVVLGISLDSRYVFKMLKANEVLTSSWAG
ncbi:hypothetical protein ACFX2I_026096 [Malus domestica]